MSNPFIQLAHRGKNQWWRYLIGALLVLFFFRFVGAIASYLIAAVVLVLYSLGGGDLAAAIPDINQIELGGQVVDGVSPIVTYIFLNLVFPFFLLGIYLALKFLHGRSLFTLITPTKRINWKRIAQGFMVHAILLVILFFVSYLRSPEDFALTFEPGAFLAFLIPVLLFTPLQTATEELFFQGYLLQGIGSHLGKWPAIILPSLLFTLLHASNPEVLTQDSWQSTASIVLYYFIVNAFSAWITIKDKSLELALGIHAANNMTLFLLVTRSNSVVPTPALFTTTALEADFSLLLMTALSLWAFSFIIFRVFKHPTLEAETT
ncbi:MAG: CPBP family intramembrane glutamic endopeptidase [Cyanobacteria bacterium P01_A01_bin.116]